MSIQEKLLDQLNRLNEIGIALSKERDIPTLLEKILVSAKRLTGADGGTIYFVTTEKKLRFEISVSDSLNYHVGGTSGKIGSFSDLPLFLENGEPNDNLMVAYVVNHKKTINVKDAYIEEGFDFSGTRQFDKKTGYRTKSVLSIPMKNHEDKVIAVLQLINPLHPETRTVREFDDQDQSLAESLASQAGIALTNQILITDLRSLFESLVKVIAAAIDVMSPSTGNHGKRVPVLALMLAEAVTSMTEGPFKNIKFNKNQLYELEVAAFLHDCGKITTPVHLVEKHTKLEGIFDRVELVSMRASFLKAQAENEAMAKKIKWFENQFPDQFKKGTSFFKECEKECSQKIESLTDDLSFISRCNLGNEPITLEAVERLEKYMQSDAYGDPLLTEDEVEHLSIKQGNLTKKEREIIQNHVVMTYKMLSQLNYPKELKEIPEIAASHHERVDGTGYPRGLKGYEMSIRARILAIADVFEALSAPDRAYKKPHSLSQVLDTMKKMVEEGHLDPNLYDVFIKKKVYMRYALKYLMPDQIDVD